MDKNFMYGIAAVKFGEKTIGYIRKVHGTGAAQSLRVPILMRSKFLMRLC